MKKPLVLTFLAALLALGLLAGCGDSDSDSGGETTTAAACEPGQLETVSDGTLTVATFSTRTTASETVDVKVSQPGARMVSS